MNKPYSTYRISIDHADTVKVDWSDFTTRKIGNGVEGKLNYQTKIVSNPDALRLIEDASADSLSDRASTRQLGEILFETLFDEGLRFRFLEIYRNVKQQDGYLRVELDIDENRLTQIAAMPWEFMCLPKNLSQEDIWLAADPHIAFSRSRSLDAIPESLRLEEGEKLKIAVVVSAPSNLGEVDIKPVQKILAKLKNDYGNKIDIFPIVDYAIKEEIEKIIDEKPHIFHFIGHGQLAERDGSEQGQIALVDELFGEADWKDAGFFAGLFTRHTPGIVLMQACEGAMRSESKALVDVAAKIGQQNVPVVVAMQYEVTNLTAGRFAVKFYESLAKGLPVDIAVQEGRFNVARNQQYQSRDFATPVLFSGVKDGYLFHPPNEDEMSPEELREATLMLLEKIEEEFNKTRLFHTRRSITIDIEEQYVPIQVTLEPHKRDIETFGGYAETEEELKRAYAARGGEEQAEEKLKQQELDWNEAKQKHQYIMVLADPGMGKSTLLGEEARTIARQEWQHLKNKKKSIEKIIIPIFVRLPELAEQLKEASTLVTDAILSLLERKYQSVFQKFPKFKSVIKERLQLLKEQVQVEKCLLLFDALDEVPKNENARNNLIEKLNDYARNFSCSIICTSRIVGYDGRCINDSKEMEIIPFRDQQIEKYIKNWFKNASEHLSDKSVTATGLLQELRSKPQVQGLVQNPLLLSLVCSLYQQEGLTLPASRCELYEQAVYYMLGQWNIDNRRTNIKEQNTDDGWILTKKELLEELAYQFSCEGDQLFKFGKLRENLEEYLKSGRVPTDLRGVKSSQLISELSEENGILQLWTTEDKKLSIEERRYCSFQMNTVRASVSRK